VVARGDADALVFDVNLDHGADDPGAHPDGATGGRVLERVLQELADDDVGGHPVAVGEGQVGRDVRDHLVLVGERAE